MFGYPTPDYTIVLPETPYPTLVSRMQYYYRLYSKHEAFFQFVYALTPTQLRIQTVLKMHTLQLYCWDKYRLEYQQKPALLNLVGRLLDHSDI